MAGMRLAQLAFLVATQTAAYAPLARLRPRVAARRASEDVDSSDAVDEDRLPRRPSPEALPEEVVAAQMVALAFGDVFRCFKFASPSNKAVTGPWQRFERMLADNPEYSPMLRCVHWKFIGGLPLDDPDKRIVRVRVYPEKDENSPPAPPMVDYEFQLSRQPDYPEDDARRPVANCWVTDGVVAVR